MSPVHGRVECGVVFCLIGMDEVIRRTLSSDIIRRRGLVQDLDRIPPDVGNGFISELSNFPIGYGMTPNPFVPGDSVEDSKRICIPMHIPKYGFPDRMYSRSGSRKPRERRCSIAVWNAPTPGKIRICVSSGQRSAPHVDNA